MLNSFFCSRINIKDLKNCLVKNPQLQTAVVKLSGVTLTPEIKTFLESITPEEIMAIDEKEENQHGTGDPSGSSTSVVVVNFKGRYNRKVQSAENFMKKLDVMKQ